MADNEIRLGLKIESDKGGASSAQKELKRLNREIEDLKDSFRDGKKDAGKFTAELADLEAQARKLDRALQSLEQPRQIDIKTDNFDRVSQDVSLAGDVESNARTVGGAFGAFGFSGAERAIGAGAEIPAVIEALPRLKAAAAGLPETFRAAADAMGTSVGAMAGLGIAVAALGVVANVARSQADKAEAGFRGQIDAQTQAIEFAATLSREELELKRAEAEQALQIAQDQRDHTKEVYNQIQQGVDDNLGTVGAGIARLNAVLGIAGGEDSLSGAIEASARAAEDAQTSLDGAGNELEAINIALESTTLSAKDAAEAERQLAEERTQGIIASAQQAGELERIRLDSADATREELETQRASLDIRKAQLEAELAALQASGDTSEQVTERIAQLTETIGFLGEQSALLDNLRSSARTQEAVDREKALESARQASTRATDEAFQKELELAKAGTERAKEATKQTQQARAPRRQRASRPSRSSVQRDPAIDEARNIQNEIIKAQNDGERQRIEQIINNNRRLQDIARDFGDQRADALEEGNFLALEQVNKEEQRAKRDQAIENRRANEDTQRATDESLRELRDKQVAFQNERARIEAQGYQNSLNQVQQFAQAMGSAFRITAQQAQQFRARLDGQRSGNSVSESQARQRGLISNRARRPVTP